MAWWIWRRAVVDGTRHGSCVSERLWTGLKPRSLLCERHCRQVPDGVGHHQIAGFLNQPLTGTWRPAFQRSSILSISLGNSEQSGHVAHVTANSKSEEVVIAIGGNVGDRVQNFNRALKLMRNAGIQIKRYACLYETVPMHFVDQPLFLNSAVSAITTLDPHSLLKVLKKIETDLGRASEGIKYGPRPIDLDIIFYGTSTVNSEVLQIPHPLFRVRPFVLAPLIDLLGPDARSSSHWSQIDGGIIKHWDHIGGEECVRREGMRRLLPVKSKLLDWSERTYIMGILNVTPDSFSDGGKFMSADNAVAHVETMISGGADFIDIGAQSTRPNAKRLSTEEELGRLLPVLEALAKLPDRDRILLSVDTFDAKVAREAVFLGADMINDVSAGCLDPDMLKTIAELEVPCVLMHMRGDPSTMLNKSNTSYADVVEDVAKELSGRIEQGELAGIPAWHIVADPGLGFSKTSEQNLQLLGGLQKFRRLSHRSLPILAGISRKSFLGKICGHAKAEDRDAATVAAAVAAILNGANIVRAHNVRAVRDAAMVADAIGRSQANKVGNF